MNAAHAPVGQTIALGGPAAVCRNEAERLLLWALRGMTAAQQAVFMRELRSLPPGAGRRAWRLAVARVRREAGLTDGPILCALDLASAGVPPKPRARAPRASAALHAACARFLEIDALLVRAAREDGSVADEAEEVAMDVWPSLAVAVAAAPAKDLTGLHAKRQVLEIVTAKGWSEPCVRALANSLCRDLAALMPA